MQTRTALGRGNGYPLHWTGSKKWMGRGEGRKQDRRDVSHLPPATMSKVLSPFSSHGTNAQHVYTFAAVAFDYERNGNDLEIT